MPLERSIKPKGSKDYTGYDKIDKCLNFSNANVLSVIQSSLLFIPLIMLIILSTMLIFFIFNLFTFAELPCRVYWIDKVITHLLWIGFYYIM